MPRLTAHRESLAARAAFRDLPWQPDDGGGGGGRAGGGPAPRARGKRALFPLWRDSRWRGPPPSKPWVPAVAEGLDRAALRTALPPGAARNALDAAFWDLEAKTSGKSVSRLAGVEPPRPVGDSLYAEPRRPRGHGARGGGAGQPSAPQAQANGRGGPRAGSGRCARRRRPLASSWMRTRAGSPSISSATRRRLPSSGSP